MRSEPMTGFVLAGGLSRRMGADKSMLRYEGATFVERVSQRLRPLVRRVVVIANERNAAALKELALDEVIVDLVPGIGPLMAVFSALMRTDTPLNLFVPCDMLWVSPEFIELLALHCADQAPGAGPLRAAAGLHPFEGLQAFPFVCHAEILHVAARFLAQPNASVQSLLSEAGARLVPVTSLALLASFRGVDTAQDYERLRAESPR